MQYLTIWDAVLTPIYLVVLSLMAKSYRAKHYPKGHPLRKYYLPGLYVKFAGAIFIALIYQFYYGQGDTYNFYRNSKVINSALDDSVFTWLKLILHFPLSGNPELYPYVIQLLFYNELPFHLVSSIGAVLGLFNGTTYIPMALLFAYISYTGIWAMYRTFVSIYPNLYKKLAIAFLFIPSTFVWGSAIFKDTICMFAIGWITYCTFRILKNKDFSLRNLLMMAICFYLIAVVKVYILLAFLPALSIWLLINYSHKIKIFSIRLLVNVFFLSLTIGGFLFFTREFAKELNRYSLERVAQTSNITRSWISYASGEEGSAYDLGEFTPTIGGMLTKFFPAVIVTLYRPFIWESKKIIVALSAIEALIFSYLTLLVFLRNGIIKTLKKIVSDPNLIFCVVFVLVFAFAVGISSYNFGALSRYKIPCLPFYGAMLFILLDTKKPSSGAKKNSRKATSLSDSRVFQSAS